MIWVTLVIVGLLTWGIRLSFIVFADRLTLSEPTRRALTFVPVAALTAILVPAILAPNGPLNLSLGNARLIAAIVAAAIAWRTRNIMLTIIVGMVLLWTLHFLGLPQ